MTHYTKKKRILIFKYTKFLLSIYFIDNNIVYPGHIQRIIRFFLQNLNFYIHFLQKSCLSIEVYTCILINKNIK